MFYLNLYFVASTRLDYFLALFRAEIGLLTLLSGSGRVRTVGVGFRPRKPARVQLSSTSLRGNLVLSLMPGMQWFK